MIFLDDLNPYYIEARYPSYKMNIGRELTDKKAKKVLKKVEDFISWLKNRMN